MVSFQEMTDAQVRGYAAMAARAGCPLLYSLNRERSPYNTELVSVSEALAEHYRLTEVPVLDTDYTERDEEAAEAGQDGGARPSSATAISSAGSMPVPARVDASGAARRAAPPPSPRRAAPARRARHDALQQRRRTCPQAIESLLAQTCERLHAGAARRRLERRHRGGRPRATPRAIRACATCATPERQAMIATWREVVERGRAHCPTAEYFAWVSDHDRWHPRWLERLVAELDADAGGRARVSDHPADAIRPARSSRRAAPVRHRGVRTTLRNAGGASATRASAPATWSTG